MTNQIAPSAFRRRAIALKDAFFDNQPQGLNFGQKLARTSLSYGLWATGAMALSIVFFSAIAGYHKLTDHSQKPAIKQSAAPRHHQ